MKLPSVVCCVNCSLLDDSPKVTWYTHNAQKIEGMESNRGSQLISTLDPTNVQTHSHSRQEDNLQCSIQTHFRKLEHPEETHNGMGRARTFLLWVLVGLYDLTLRSSNYCGPLTNI